MVFAGDFEIKRGELMRTFTEEELKTILENHKHYLTQDCENWKSMRADLSNADLSDANLSNANLRFADLSDARNVPYISMVCPEEDEFIGWKKAQSHIIKLLIPSDAKRSSATSRKCRCNKAKVLAIYTLDGKETGLTEIHSDYDKNFIYKVGETVEVTDFDENRWKECTTGIHFFINRQEDINY